MDDPTDTLFDALERNGYRLTAARRAIVAALVASRGHVSADELVARVRRTTPGIGRMTVYRTLDLLLGLGLIRPVYLGTAAAHYILLEDGHHHHLVCTDCERVIEIDQCVISDLEKVVRADHNFEIHGHLLEIFGRCKDCQAQL